MRTPHFLMLCISLLLSVVAVTSYGGECVYTLYVKTGSIIKAGTDSKISLSLGDPLENWMQVQNLESWGLMGPNHDYYERGNLDIFSGRGPCINSPICRLNLTSDGSGGHHGWYCDNVEVTSTGPNKECSQTVFYVNQWLANDVYPYELSAKLDGCTLKDQNMEKKVVVAKHMASASA